MEEAPPPVSWGRSGRAIDRAARLSALAGGVVLVGVMGLSAASVAGRWLLGSPIQGDFEIVQLGLAVSIASFLPLCQTRGANIVVDFFTAGVGRRARRVLDSTGALLLAAAILLVAWRTGAGAIDIRASGESTMVLGLPVWIAYALMVPPLLLTALAGVHAALGERKAGGS